MFHSDMLFHLEQWVWPVDVVSVESEWGAFSICVLERNTESVLSSLLVWKVVVCRSFLTEKNIVQKAGTNLRTRVH